MQKQIAWLLLLCSLLMGCNALEFPVSPSSVPLPTPSPTSESSPIIKYEGIFDIAFSPDGTKLVIGAFDGAVTVWDVRTGTQETRLGTLTDYVTRVAWSNPDQQGISYIAACSFSGLEPITIWNAVTKEKIHSLRAGGAQCTGLEFAPKSLLLAVGQSDAGRTDSGIAIFDVETGEEPIVFPNSDLLGEGDRTPGGLAWSSDGTVLAFTDWGYQIFLWDTSQPNSVRGISTDPITVANIDWSADGSLLLASTEIPGTLGIWNAESLELIHELPAQGPIQYDTTFSPVSSIFAYGDHQGRVFLMDALSGTVLDSFEVYRAYANAVAWSPDGKRLAMSISSWIYIWEIE